MFFVVSRLLILLLISFFNAPAFCENSVSEKMAQQAVDLARSKGNSGHKELIDALNKLDYAYKSQGAWGKREGVVKEILATRETVFGKNAKWVAFTLTILA